MTILAWLIYVPLQIVWLPLSILGVLWLAYKQVWISRKRGLSQTAIEVVNGRWTADLFGLRPDPASRRLAGKLPNNSVLGLFVTLFPLLLARTIAGKPIVYPVLPDDDKAGISNIVFSRTRRFDDLVAGRAAEVAQFVVLGAGLDTRCYGPLAKQGLSLFELDRAADQRAKRKAVQRAGLGSGRVCYIEVDFSQPQWIAALSESSYDPALKTIFLWEGVTPYLSEADVRATLAALKSHSASGSVVVLDLYAQRFLKLTRSRVAGNALAATGEAMNFGLGFSTDADGVLRAFADSVNFRLGTHYFIGTSHRQGAYMAAAELIVPA